MGADPGDERFRNRTQAATPPASGDTRANTNAGVGPALTRDVLVAKCVHFARSSSRPWFDEKESPAIASVAPDERCWFVAEALVGPDAGDMAEAIVGSPASSRRIPQSAAAPSISRVEAMEEVTDPAG